MDFTGDAKLATFAYELGAQAASQVKLVGWLPGDEFDVVRKESIKASIAPLPSSCRQLTCMSIKRLAVERRGDIGKSRMLSFVKGRQLR